jgi:transcriptional regulator with XRE-family HTH domain
MKSSYSPQEKQLLVALGDHIKQLRKQINLSQEKLAFVCGLDRTYVGSVERGERNISIINLKKIADALQVELSELLNFKV